MVAFRYFKLGFSNGESHLMLHSPPKTDLRLLQRFFLPHLGSSCLSDSICVSSENMADICVQNMINVKMPKRSDSKPSRIIRMSVVAGEKFEHSAKANAQGSWSSEARMVQGWSYIFTRPVGLDAFNHVKDDHYGCVERY